MIKIENVDIHGWEAAVRGMRNAYESWDKSDSGREVKMRRDIPGSGIGVLVRGEYIVGENDFALMRKLVKAGSDHRKFLRFITVTVDITAPLYWWKEFDTYKVGTVANSCSTMHTIHRRDLTLDDFSHEHLRVAARNQLQQMIDVINIERRAFMGKDNTKLKGDKECWYSMIQLLPTSYNQRRTVLLNYEVLWNMYHARRNHRLDEWVDFCHWVETLPYAELIMGGVE